MLATKRVFARKCSLRQKPLCPYMSDDRGYVSIRHEKRRGAIVHPRRKSAFSVLQSMFW